MKKSGARTADEDVLRRRAEAQLRKDNEEAGLPSDEMDTARLLHELQVHQIELEMQNHELQRTQAQTEAALEKYTDLYDFAPAGYLTLSREGTIRAANFIGANILGEGRSSLIGRSFIDFVSGETRPTLNAFLEKIFAGTATFSCEVVLQSEGISPRIARVAATVGTTGEECRVIVVDITKSKENEVKLKDDCANLETVVIEQTADLVEANLRLQHDLFLIKESEDRYQRLLASITSYVYRVDIVNDVAVHTEYGDGCRSVTGYSPEDYARETLLWISMIPPEDSAAVLDFMACIPTAREPIEIEHRIIHKDGRLRWIRNTIIQHHDKTNALTSYDGIIVDITERRLHEEERLRLELEVRQGEKLRILGQLAAGVAHEVRNPLNSIVISAELLAERLKDNPECQQYLDRIQRQIERLENLMKDLLELRRPEDASNRQRCAVAAICRMAINDWKQSHKKLRRQLIVEFTPESEQAMIFVDSSRVIRVIINMLDNAIQHSPTESKVSISATGSANGFAVICVHDQGMGFSEENLLLAFDPFFTTRKGGSGLGLSITKHIIETYSGQVSIRNNTPHPGCTVEIRLPVVTETSNETVNA